MTDERVSAVAVGSSSREIQDSGLLSLVVEPPSGECLRIQVSRNPFLIGRLPACDLTLRDSRISRRHARIRLKDGAYSIEDLDSRHGLTVNGETVQRCRLIVGDRIGFGIEDSFVITVDEGLGPRAPLLKKVAKLSAEASRTGALGRLSAVLEVARSMESSEGVEDVFEAVVEAALTIARADRAFLLLREESGALDVKVARSASGGVGRLGIPCAAIAEALDRRRDLFTMTIGPEPAHSRDAGPARTNTSPETRSALCVPILRMRIGQDHETSVVSAKKDTLGVLYMDSRDPDVRLAEGNQALLQALAIETSTVLENARLIEEEREKRRLEQELRIARDIQKALLPVTLPSEGWLIAKGHSEASSQVGGDYYDVVQVAPGKWVAVVADVSGKGVAASLLASLLQGAFFLGSDPEVCLPRTLSRINRYICERSSQSRFATVFALVLSEDGNMRWSNAGHCPAILARGSGGVEWLQPNSVPVGLFDDTEFAEDACCLLPGDKLVIYSDGVSETRNSAGEQLGEERLGHTASQLAGLGAAQFFDSLLDSVQEFAASTPRPDDFTVLTLGFQGA